jgi:hypothetical protein
MMEEMVMDGCTVEKVDQTSWHAPSPWREVLLLVILKRPPVRNLLFCSVQDFAGQCIGCRCSTFYLHLTEEGTMSCFSDLFETCSESSISGSRTCS